jgi:hypothetical protein
LLQQPPAAIDYGEANRQANQEYDWTSEKEFLYHDNRTLAGLFVGFCGLGSLRYSVLGHSILIYPCQALAMLGHLSLFLDSPPFSSFLFGFPSKLVLV